jgi:hypothetical protein
LVSGPLTWLENRDAPGVGVDEDRESVGEGASIDADAFAALVRAAVEHHRGKEWIQDPRQLDAATRRLPEGG